MKLKKIFVLALFAVVISGCIKNDVIEVSKLEFKLDDGNVPEQYYSEVKMVMVPNYEKRILTVDYNRIFPKRTLETTDDDIQVTGVTIGGDNFERFLSSVDYITKLETDEGFERNEDKSMFYVDVYVVGNGLPDAVAMNWDAEGSMDSELEALKSFYLDVAELLTQNEPV